ELTAICISGAAGLLLGWSILSPGRQRRIDALMAAAQEAVVLITGAAAMLFIAAWIEASWSSSTSVAIPVKYLVAAMLWLFVTLYLTLAGRGRDAA
ncbi:MAG: stage II sporulation protein M, partial [Gammaproteobacteria bacterium]